MKHDAILKDVYRITVGRPVLGRIYEDSGKRFPDGADVVTSRVRFVMVDGDKTYIRTGNTTYLTQMSIKDSLGVKE